MLLRHTFRTHSLLPLTALIALSGPLSAIANPVECRQGELIRTVEIVYAEPGSPVPCEVMYAKPAAGTIEMLWQAMNETGYCEARTEEFVAKLESAGWQCSDTQAAAADEDG